MKKIILLGIIAAAALAGIYYLFPQQQTADNQPRQFSSAEELNAFINASYEAGIYGGSVMSGAASETAAQKAVSDISQPTSDEAAAPSAGGSEDYSQTNIQVAGVDEADIVKTDGKYIYAVSGNKASIIDAYPADSAKIVSTLEFNGSAGEIYVSGNRLVVFGQESHQYPITAANAETGSSGASGAAAEKMIASESIMRPYYYSPRTFIEVYDVSDKASPKLARNISVDGSYFDSRMIGDYVYVIARQPAYNYGGGPVPLPVVRSNGVAKETPATDIYYFGMPDSSFAFTNILSLNTQTNEEPSSKTFLTGYSQNMYASQDSIYIVYQKRVSETKIYDRMVDEIIIPAVPADAQNKIGEIRNSSASYYEKMREIGKTFDDYLARLNPEQGAAIMKTAEEKMIILQAEIAKEMEKTVIHKISIDNGKIEYKTNGEVPGQPLNQFSMDESSGYFRIATTTSGSWGGGIATSVMSSTQQIPISDNTVSQKMAQSAPASSQTTPQNLGTDITQKKNDAPARITDEEHIRINEERIKEQGQTLRTEPQLPQPQVSGPLNHLYVLDGDLKIVGKVEDLAAGERIYSVRFLGDKAYMVTFRQIDPLFVIDLSDPSSPKVLGYLKVPGVSDYLHPYDETHIIGVGRDASDEGRIRGLKLAFFDVSDFANPKEVSKHIIGDQGTYSEALNDHKAFLFGKEKNILVIPVSEYSYAEPAATEGKWEQPKYWQGAYVFNLDLANGFALKGKITHTNETAMQEKNYYYDWSSQIRRSLFIENALYTVSNKMIKMNSLSDLSEINKVEFPTQTIQPYMGMGIVE